MSKPGKQSHFLHIFLARVLLSVENWMVILLKLVFALCLWWERCRGGGLASFLHILAWPPHCWWGGGTCLWFRGASGDRVVAETPISPNYLSGILAWKWLSFHRRSVSLTLSFPSLIWSGVHFSTSSPSSCLLVLSFGLFLGVLDSGEFWGQEKGSGLHLCFWSHKQTFSWTLEQ